MDGRVVAPLHPQKCATAVTMDACIYFIGRNGVVQEKYRCTITGWIDHCQLGNGRLANLINVQVHPDSLGYLPQFHQKIILSLKILFMSNCISYVI